MEKQKLKIDNITVIDDFFDEEDFAKIFELSKIKLLGEGGRYEVPVQLLPHIIPKLKKETEFMRLNPPHRHIHTRHANEIQESVLHHDFNGQPKPYLDRKFTFILYIEVDTEGEQQELIFPYYNTEKELVSNKFTDMCDDQYARGIYCSQDEQMDLELCSRKDEFFKVSPRNNRALFMCNDIHSWHIAAHAPGIRRNFIIHYG